MQRLLILFLALFLAGCASSNVPESERTRTLDASSDQVFDATVSYLQNAGYEISDQFKPTVSLPEGEITTAVHGEGNMGEKIACILRPTESGATKVSVHVTALTKNLEGAWVPARKDKNTLAQRHREVLRGIEDLL